MLPSRYMLIDEKSPYPVKRRVRGRGDKRGSDSAITLLPPDPYLIVEKPEFRLSSPTVYRTTAPKSAKNKEASSFVILGETMRTPVQSRPGSPSGRVSPFRGHGFKSPTTTRANSRAPSPSDSPRKSLKLAKSGKTLDRPRIGRDIGLPPRSPSKSQGLNLETKRTTLATATAASEKPETNDGEGEAESEVSHTKAETEEEKTGVDAEFSVVSKRSETSTNDRISDCSGVSELPEAKKTDERAVQPPRHPPPAVKTKPGLTPAAPGDKKPPVSPGPNSKSKAEKNQQSVAKKPTKPPVAPKKFGLKTSLKTEENVKGQEKKRKKEEIKGKEEASGECQRQAEGTKGKDDASGELGRKNEVQTTEFAAANKEDNRSGRAPKETSKEGSGAEEPETLPVGKPKAGEATAVDDEREETQKPEVTAEKPIKSDSKSQKLIPCFQPDKCQIAPPTMASPSPIITPTISTPSMTSDLTSSSIKNSQSIAAAPTTVTPSSLGSVSSTVVLTGNLTRKQIESRTKSKEPATANSASKETDLSVPPKNPSQSQMVKAATKDAVEWSKKDNLSGEMTSTKVIKADPDMEVLSPNNLRESPPRMPPPNLAWDEGRLPNGDVPNKAEKGGKFRRVISAVWKFLSYVFCCRCLSASKCCRSSSQEGTGKPSLTSKLNWRKLCRNPFGCCACKCKPKCCEGKNCCRKRANPGKPKSRKCCAKTTRSGKGCCDKLENLCRCSRDKLNSICRSLFCLNMLCCQKFLRKFKCCHKFKCCQKNGFCSCCNPNVKKETKKLNKKGSRTSNNSRDKDNLDVVLVEHTSLMKAAIPVLPSCLAVFCLILNLFVPGFGTFVSGILCLCFGKPRFSVKDTPKSRMGSFILNTIIGVAQLFTVVFCLVGWGWSIWWGVIMYKLSRRQKRLKLAEKNQKEAEGSNVNHNHIDVEQG